MSSAFNRTKSQTMIICGPFSFKRTPNLSPPTASAKVLKPPLSERILYQIGLMSYQLRVWRWNLDSRFHSQSNSSSELLLMLAKSITKVNRKSPGKKNQWETNNNMVHWVLRSCRLYMRTSRRHAPPGIWISYSRKRRIMTIMPFSRSTRNNSKTITIWLTKSQWRVVSVRKSMMKTLKHRSTQRNITTATLCLLKITISNLSSEQDHSYT